MHAARLLRRRARAHLGLLALVGVQVALTTAAVAGAIGYVTLAERDGLRDALGSAEPADAALRVVAGLGDDLAAQDAAASAVLAEDLGDLPVVVHRSLATVGLPAGTPANADTGPDLGLVTLWSDAELPAVAELTAGTWPDDAATADAPGTPEDPAPATLHADAAERLGLSVGDEIYVVTGTLSTRVLEVVGLWQPRDADDVRWFGDPLPRQGVSDDGETAGPFVVTEPLLVGLENARSARWTLVPDADALLPAAVADLRAALAAAVDDLDDDPDVDVRGLTTDGDLRATLATLDARLGGVRGVTTAAVLLVALTGLIALAQMARLLADVRLAETLVLRSRGTTVSQVTAASALEAGVVGVVGAAVGTGVAALALRPVGDPPGAVLLATGVAAALATAGLLAWRAGSHAIGIVRRGRSDAAGRGLRAVGVGGVVVAAAAALLAWWQLDRYGSPVFTTADGRVAVDPLAAGALTLGLLTLGLVAVLVLAPAAGAAAVRAAKRRDLMPVLATRELARHTPLHGVAVVLVVLAAGAGTVAAGYAGTLRAWRDDVGHAAVGADVRLDVAPGPSGAVSLTEATRWLSAVDDARPVRELGFGTATATGELVGVVRDGNAGAAGSASSDAVSAATLVSATAPALLVPPTARELGLRIQVDGPGPEATANAGGIDVTARVWIGDDAGNLAVLEGVPLEREDPAVRSWTVEVPGDDPSISYPLRWQLRDRYVLAVDLTWDAVPADAGGAADAPDADASDDGVSADGGVSVEIAWLAADGTDLLAAANQDWMAIRFTDSGAAPVPLAAPALTADGPRVRVPDGALLRFLPGVAEPMPVHVTSGWRAGVDVGDGEVLPVRIGGIETEVVLEGDVPVVAGTTPARQVTVPGATSLLADAGPSARSAADAADGDAARTALAAEADLRDVNRLLLEHVAEVPAADAVLVTTDDPDAVVAEAAALEPAGWTPGVRGSTAEVLAATDVAAPGRDRLAEPALVATGLAAAFALVVMVPGVASTALALALARRRETAVLRALGVGPGAQARARRAELGVVVGAAVVVGVAAGVAVAALCVPALVRATAPGPAALPVALTFDEGGLVATVLGAGVLLAAVVAGYGGAVARQARSGADLEDRS